MVGIFTAGVASAASLDLYPTDDLVARTTVLQAGDELILHEGTYTISERLQWSVVGTAAAPVIIRAADDEAVVIELVPGEEGEYDSRIMQVDSSSWITIEGLTFAGGGDWSGEGTGFGGLRISNSSDITLIDLEIAQTGSTALYLSDDNQRITVERTHIHDVRDGYGVYVGCSDASCWTDTATFSTMWVHDIGGANSYAMHLSHGSQGITITDSVFHGIEHRGVFLGSTEFGAANVFEGNAIWDITTRGLYIQGAAVVRNNLVFNVDEVGIYTSDAERGTYQDIVISFNTVVQTGDWALQLNDTHGLPGMVVANNALCNPVGFGVHYDLPEGDTGVGATGLITGNIACGLVEGLDEGLGEISAGAGYTDFSDIESWNFYPSGSGAALVDAADPSGDTYVPELDFNGVAREGDRPDVGAYEWSGADNPGWQVQEGFKTFELAQTGITETVGGCCSREDNGEQAALLLPLLTLAGLRRRR